MWRGSDYLSQCTQNRTCCKSCSFSVVGPGEISQLATELAAHHNQGRGNSKEGKS